MKITFEQTNQMSLAGFGAELVQLIKDRDYKLIADRFGYAIAFDRPLVDAIAADIDSCLGGDGRFAKINLAIEARILVKYFEQPNSLNHFGLVECFLPLAENSGELLAELLISTRDHEFYLSLEDISYAS